MTPFQEKMLAQSPNFRTRHAYTLKRFWWLIRKHPDVPNVVPQAIRGVGRSEA